MRGVGLFMVVVAAATPVLAQDRAPDPSPKTFVSRLIAEAKAEGVFADASTGSEPRARHLASGLVCRFAEGPSAALQLLPARVRGDNVGCVTPLGAGVLALQAQRLPATVPADRFLDDMVAVVHSDFAGAAPVPPSIADRRPPDGLGARAHAQFKAAFKGQPVYVEVSAVRVGPWMVSSHLVAPLKDAAAPRAAEAEVYAAAQAVERAPRER